MQAAADAGAHVVVTYFSGIVDERDHVRLGGYPGAFRELLGVRTTEFLPLLEGQRVEVAGLGGTAVGADTWAEDLELTGAGSVELRSALAERTRGRSQASSGGKVDPS